MLILMCKNTNPMSHRVGDVVAFQANNGSIHEIEIHEIFGNLVRGYENLGLGWLEHHCYKDQIFKRIYS